MTNKTRCFVFLLGICIWCECLGFETETHAVITNKAYKDSNLFLSGIGSIVDALGLNRLDASNAFNVYWKSGSFGIYYIGGSNVDPRQFELGVIAGFLVGAGSPEEFERCQMREFLAISAGDVSRREFRQDFVQTVSDSTGSYFPATDAFLPIRNWLVRGAIREDDLGIGEFYEGVAGALRANCGAWWLATVGAQPGGMVRPYNHFYDPISGSGLNISIGPFHYEGKPSPDWALGYRLAAANPPVVDTNRKNTYSYTDARNTFYWALTRELTREPGKPYTAFKREADAYDRMFLWATAFRSLGDVVHLLEDTGQPQHTCQTRVTDDLQPFRDFAQTHSSVRQELPCRPCARS